MKKLLSLTLALLMTLSLAACGSKSEPTPEPHTGVEAIIAYALHGDAEGLRAAYGFDSAQEAVDALAQGADLRTVMADSLLDTLADSDMAPSEPTLERLTQSILDLLGRMEFSCRTLSREGDTAVVEVTVSTLPADTFTDGLTGYATPRVMESLDKITVQIALIAVAYLVAYGLMAVLGSLLPAGIGGVLEADEIGLPVTASGLTLPCGATAMWHK